MQCGGFGCWYTHEAGSWGEWCWSQSRRSTDSSTGEPCSLTCLSCGVRPACSRNARLSPEARSNALSISAALQWAQQAVAQGEVSQADDIAGTVRQRIAAAGGDVDYVEVSSGDVFVCLSDTGVVVPHGQLRANCRIVLVCCASVVMQLRDADNLSLVTDASKQPTLLAVAAKYPAKDKGTVRLIDNIVLQRW